MSDDKKPPRVILCGEMDGHVLQDTLDRLMRDRGEPEVKVLPREVIEAFRPQPTLTQAIQPIVHSIGNLQAKSVLCAGGVEPPCPVCEALKPPLSEESKRQLAAARAKRDRKAAKLASHR